MGLPAAGDDEKRWEGARKDSGGRMGKVKTSTDLILEQKECTVTRN